MLLKEYKVLKDEKNDESNNRLILKNMLRRY